MTHLRRHAWLTRMIGMVMGCVGVCLMHCTTSLTGGNSSETTNVAVITDEGLPATSAIVKLIDGDNWAYQAAKGDPDVIDSATTDQHGIASFSHLPETACNLQIDHAGEGVFIRNFKPKGKIASVTDTIHLQQYATVLGSCIPDSGTPVTVLLEGTAYSSPVNATRSFSFSDIAPGSYPMLFRSLSGDIALVGSAVVAPDQTIAKNALLPSFSSLLIDDFESGYSASVLGQFTNACWYDYADSSKGGNSKANHALQTEAPQGVFCLTANITLQKPYKDPWAGIGIQIGTKKPDWDLSAMTAITFIARGDKGVRISVESPFIDSINNDWPNFGKIIELDSTWRFFRIPISSLTLPSSKAQTLGITWATAAKRIYKIEFEGVSSTIPDSIHFQLDDIRIEGMTAADLFRQMTPEKIYADPEH
jgi:hypothetical protein